MVLAFPILTSFLIILLLVMTGFKIVDLLFPGQPSEPRK